LAAARNYPAACFCCHPSTKAMTALANKVTGLKSTFHLLKSPNILVFLLFSGGFCISAQQRIDFEAGIYKKTPSKVNI